MVKVKFTSALSRFFPNLKEMEIEGSTVFEVISKVNEKIPGISNYILEEDGSLRKHVNIFLNDDLIVDRKTLSDEVKEREEILIYQALSGG